MRSGEDADHRKHEKVKHDMMNHMRIRRGGGSRHCVDAEEDDHADAGDQPARDCNPASDCGACTVHHRSLHDVEPLVHLNMSDREEQRSNLRSRGQMRCRRSERRRLRACEASPPRPAQREEREGGIVLRWGVLPSTEGLLKAISAAPALAQRGSPTIHRSRSRGKVGRGGDISGQGPTVTQIAHT